MNKCDKCSHSAKKDAPCSICSENPFHKDRFEEIENEPIKTGDLVSKFLLDMKYGHPDDIKMFRMGDKLQDIFFTLYKVAELSERNNELRHRQKQTFEVFWYSIGIYHQGITENEARIIWKTAQKAVGVE